MTIDEIITRVLNDDSYRTKLASSFGEGKHFECSDNQINENLFISFINGCEEDKDLFKIFENINYMLNVEKNITDNVFWELVKFAQKKKKERWFVFLDLCHGDLKPQHKEFLHSLKYLNESFFY